MSNTKIQTQKFVLGAILTALVVVLQLLGAFIRFGPFSISLVLVPIVIGSALCDYKIGAWLGFVFGAAVLISGDAANFFAINVFGTFVTVLLKGILCGLAAGLTYKFLEKHSRYIAIISAAIVCPIVNTGIFLLGCSIFFLSALEDWGLSGGFSSTVQYMFLGLVGVNFLAELTINLLLAPAILRIVDAVKKRK